MILSEIPMVDSSIAKLDTSDDDFNFSRRVSKRAGSPIRPVSIVLEDDNDDDDERLARRKSRLLEPHPASVVSPHGATGGSSVVQRRADAAAPRGISQAQIGEHYGTCIRLAAENKITSRNAFNLHLIDYMSDMLKNEDYASFQIASSSLDAGAKIYAGRVDAVHQETYQVLTGLGRPDKQQPSNGDDNAFQKVDGSEECSEAPGRNEQRRKAQMHREILQKHLNKIRSKALAAKADVDPLFQHQTAAYDEGGTAELRLNQLNTLDDTCSLILDSSTPVLSVSVSKFAVEAVFVSDMLLETMSHVLPNRIAVNQLVLCPSLQNFRFTDWDPSKDTWESSTWNDSVVNQPSQEAPYEPAATQNVVAILPDDTVDDNAPDDDDNTLVGQPGDDDIDEAVISESAEKATTKGDYLTAAAVEPDPAERTETEGELFVTSLKSMLNKQYEYFGQMNDNLLGMWAGPDHWRKKAKRRKYQPDEAIWKGSAEDETDGENADPESVTVGVSKMRKNSRGKKARPTKITYLETSRPSENRTRNGNLSRADWPKNVLSEGLPNTVSANATVFKEHYRQRASRQMNQLPSEPTDSRNALYQLCNREIILESNHPHGNPPRWDAAKDDAYQAANADFCPQPATWADRPDGGGGDFVNGVIPTDLDNDLDHPLDDDYDGPIDDAICIADEDDDATLPFEGAFTQPMITAFNEFGRVGDLELVSQPHQVARIEIGYARTAKMINIRRLKLAMWSFLESSLSSLCAPFPVPPRSPVASVASTSSAPASLPGDGTSDVDAQQQRLSPLSPSASCPPSTERCSFGDVLTSLSSRITWQMAKELSISISLNCLLHLCNEKSLFLDHSDKFSDIYISQGLPETEVEMIKSLSSDGSNDPIVGCDGAAKRHARDVNKRQAKAKRLRPSTLDSWLDAADPSEHIMS